MKIVALYFLVMCLTDTLARLLNSGVSLALPYVSCLIPTSHTIAGWFPTARVGPGGGCRREGWSELAMGVEGRG